MRSWLLNAERLFGDIAFSPVVEIEDCFADIETFSVTYTDRWIDDCWGILETRLFRQTLNCGCGKRVRRVDANALDVFRTIWQNMKMLNDKDGSHDA